MAARNFLPRCNAFFYRIPIESLKICDSNEMHLGTKFLAAIFSAILYCSYVRAIHCTFIAMGLNIFGISLKIDVAYLSREVKRSMHVVLCKENPCNLINVFGSFSVILQSLNFYKVS